MVSSTSGLKLLIFLRAQSDSGQLSGSRVSVEDLIIHPYRNEFLLCICTGLISIRLARVSLRSLLTPWVSQSMILTEVQFCSMGLNSQMQMESLMELQLSAVEFDTNAPLFNLRRSSLSNLLFMLQNPACLCWQVTLSSHITNCESRPRMCSGTFIRILLQSYMVRSFSFYYPRKKKQLSLCFRMPLHIQFIPIMITTKKIYVLLLIVTLSIVAVCETFTKSDREKIMVQSDHFSSDTETTFSHKLSHVQVGKPMLFLLKRKSSKKADPSLNHITVSFSSASQKQECILKEYTDLCVVEEVEEEDVTLNLKCTQTPCEVSWVIYQLQINKVNPGQLAQGLFTLQNSGDHLVAFITCNDPQRKHFSDDVALYSSSHFQRGGSGNQLHFLFANQQKGFLYIDIKEQSKKCAHLSIANTPKKIEYSNTMIRDFATKDSSAKFQLSIPKSDFRMDCMLNKLDKSSFTSPVTFTLSGVVANSSQILSEYTISAVGKEKVIEISITFKQPEKNFDRLQMEVVTKDNKFTVIGFVINQAAVQEVDVSERNYFDLKKGQKISYQLLPDEEAKDDDKVYFLPSNKTGIKLSQQSCSAKSGCKFELTAQEDIHAYLHFSSSPEPKYAIEYVSLTKSTKRKIKEGQTIYFKKQVEANKVFEIAVNSPNIILYASSFKKCVTPDEDCNERSGNYLHPFVYDPKEDGQFIIAAQGLENCEFIITVIAQNDEYIRLSDGVSFSYRIEEDQDEILFKYKLKEKMDVSFNLVAPLNHLKLLVTNGEDRSDEYTEVSSQGYVSFQKDQLKSLNFIIAVKKTELTNKKMTHFTLLASSSKAVIRLEPTVAHYQTLKPDQTRQYIFEFDTKEDYILNFYTHNLKEDIKIMLALSNNRVWNESNLEMIWIDRPSDVLDLKMAALNLCSREGQESCEIFLLLNNEMEVEVDITITLMMRYSIIELKDGIWQSYLEATIAKDAYFYFYPKHIDKNVVILYSTIMQDLRLAYTLWKTDSKAFDPTQWPFPQPKDDKNGPSIRTVNHVTIDKELLKKECWPNCLVLITLYKDTSINPGRRFDNADFKIMASNNQIQLPEKTRINLVLRNNEEKQLIIDLKYVLDKEVITLYTSHSIGNSVIFANVISVKQPRCPEISVNTDFQIQHGETTIEVNKIKQKIKELKMEQDGNVQLCLLARGVQDGKFSIEYVTDRKEIQMLHTNSFQSVALDANQTKVYQIGGYMQFVAKIIRTRGYPYLDIKKCSLDDLKECQSSFLQSRQWGKQMVKKSEQFSENPCQNCIYLLKFQAMEPCAVTVHINTYNSETELKEHDIITDFIEPGEESRYFITHVKNQDLSVNIHAIQGDVQVAFSNYQQVSLLKYTEHGRKTIHFFIPKSYHYVDQQAPSENAVASFGSFDYSSAFGSFHLVISGKNPNATTTFSITYSSGQNRVKLQDGLITDVVLEPNVAYTFMYENQNQDSSAHIYFTLSAKEESILSLLNISSYQYDYDKEGEQESKVEFQLQIPKIRKKTPNPSYLLSLPEKNYFQIVLTNPTTKPKIVSLGINHQQLVILPFDHEYPFTLHPKEDINFLVEVSSPGFIHAQIRKCDESEPLFSYSFDYNAFVKGQFQIERELTEDPKFEELIKVSRTGTFYINIKALDQTTVLAINLKFLSSKPQKGLLKAGGKGLLEYELIESKKAVVSFAPVVCAGGDCLGIKYFSMSSSKLSDLYSQLVCPSSFFSTTSMQTAEAITLKPIKYEQKAEMISFNETISQHSLFVGVKAVTGSGEEVYYRPFEIITIWGHLSKTSQSYKLTVGCIILVSICALLLFVRHNARRGYRRIQEGERT